MSVRSVNSEQVALNNFHITSIYWNSFKNWEKIFNLGSESLFSFHDLLSVNEIGIMELKTVTSPLFTNKICACSSLRKGLPNIVNPIIFWLVPTRRTSQRSSKSAPSWDASWGLDSPPRRSDESFCSLNPPVNQVKRIWRGGGGGGGGGGGSMFLCAPNYYSRSYFLASVSLEANREWI